MKTSGGAKFSKNRSTYTILCWFVTKSPLALVYIQTSVVIRPPVFLDANGLQHHPVHPTCDLQARRVGLPTLTLMMLTATRVNSYLTSLSSLGDQRACSCRADCVGNRSASRDSLQVPAWNGCDDRRATKDE